ncbi:MAG: lytic transglycosylase domain-containing protein [Actinomycetales bacterium]
MCLGRALRSLAVVALVLAVLAAAAWWGLGRAREAGVIGPVVVPAEYRALIREAAARCPAVPVEVFAAQIAQESRWDPTAVSPAGARGIAQFMPKVWKQYGIDANADGKRSVWDPHDAIHSAAELNCVNRRLVRKVSGDRLANTLAAYNAGYGAVRKYDGIPPFPETQAYVARILQSAKTIVL